MKKKDPVEEAMDGRAAYERAGLGLIEAADFHGLLVKKATRLLKRGPLKTSRDLSIVHLANEAIRERNAVCGDRATRKQPAVRKGPVVFDIRKLTKDECI